MGRTTKDNSAAAHIVYMVRTDPSLLLLYYVSILHPRASCDVGIVTFVVVKSCRSNITSVRIVLDILSIVLLRGTSLVPELFRISSTQLAQ